MINNIGHIGHVGGFGCVALLAVASMVFSCAVGAQQVPENLRPPANEQLLFRVHAKGDQVYVCKGEAGQFTWTLKAPDAQLFDQDGKAFGKHFAGPSWEANDGSFVTGKAVANTPSPDPDSIPWLLINVVSHGSKTVLSRTTPASHIDTSKGVLARVTTLQRINTKGGKAPASGCDSAHSGGEVRVEYSADYLFYAPK